MWARLRSFAVMVFRRTQWERDLRDEFDFHIAARADALERGGLTRDEASRRARIEFRGLETAKERCREARGTRWLDEVSRNVTCATRSIRQHPGFSVVAVISLALGIGANLAVFGVLHRLVLTELPVQDANQLYEVVVVSQNRTDRGMSYPKFELIRDNFTFFKPAFGWGELGRYPLTHGTTEQIVRVHAVTGNYFEGLGLNASIGRLFTSADDHSDQAVVLSHELWRLTFARDPGIVGRSVKVGKAQMVVVGIGPPGFRGMTPASPVDVFLTLPGFEHLQPAVRQRANFQWFHVIGRLTGDVAVDAARAIVREQWPRLDDENRRRYQRNTRDILLLEDASQGFSRVGLEFSGAIAVLMGLVAAVFLIACANLATMLFVRGAGRVREMSIRFALGAARSQLVGQWMTECLILAVIGGIVGVFAARWITDLLLLFVAENDRPWLRFESGPGVLLPAIALTISAGLLCGLMPALRATRTRPEVMLRAQSSASAERHSLLTQAVLAMQLAACFVLVVGAALFARTLWNLNHVSSGFDRDTIVYAAPDFREAGLPGNEYSSAVMSALDRLRHSPHISEVTLGPPPMVWGDGGWNYVTKASGYALAPDEDNTAWTNSVLPGYFGLMDIP